MQTFSITLPGGRPIHHAHWGDQSENDRRIYAFADADRDIPDLLERFVGRTYGEEKDRLISFTDAKLEGTADMATVLHAAQRFLGSVKITGAIYIFEREPDGWKFSHEWVVAREGDKERVVYSDDPGNSTSPAGIELAQSILSYF